MRASFAILAFCLQLSAYAQKTVTDSRDKIGSTYSAPIKHAGKYYFVSTAGVLLESDKEFKKPLKLFEGKRQSLGSLVLHEEKLIWGDGMHSDQKSSLYIYDLKTKKLLKEISLAGHIERPPLITGKMVVIPAGPAGVFALSLTDFKELWHATVHEKRKLHVDSNIVEVESKLCATSVYELKGVVCLDPQSGKVLQFASLIRDPKSEITVWKNHVLGFATEGDLMRSKWDLPADLYVYDVKTDKMKMNKELRGFNFFAPVINGDEAFVTLSTGDFILVNLTNGQIQFMGEFPEPFTNNSFMYQGNYCGIGIMGKYMCYSKTKGGFALAKDKRLMETVVGEIFVDQTKVVVPTRVGFYQE
jgi:hypothetical protein